jgi:hypothetical protein
LIVRSAVISGEAWSSMRWTVCIETSLLRIRVPTVWRDRCAVTRTGRPRGHQLDPVRGGVAADVRGLVGAQAVPPLVRRLRFGRERFARRQVWGASPVDGLAGTNAAVGARL